MKRIALAAALGLATSAQAAGMPPDPWIVISLPEFGSATEAAPALVAPQRYASATECFYNKGQVEQYLKDRFPKASIVVWCAQVPGLHR